MRVTALARELSLLLCGAVAAYLLGAWLAAKVALALAGTLRSDSIALRVVAGALALDLTKAPGLLGAAWLLGPAIRIRSTVAATVLVLLCFALDALVAALLQQLGWLWGQAPVLLCRLATAALLIWLVALVLRRRRVAPAPGAPGDRPG